MVTTGPDREPGINGGLMPRHGLIDGQAVIAYVCTIDVPSVDAALEKALSLGGQLALAKIPIPGIGWLAYAKDTEGNIFGMMQNDQSAK
jgi:predicted enzyme related to lactoylglutathione lyase